MIKTLNSKHSLRVYDLEERTFVFASSVNSFLKSIIVKTIANVEYSKQLVRSSGSVAANYIEANEALSKKDFVYRIKICRKEVKESRLWLKLLDIQNDTDLILRQENLIKEALELIKIFTAIIVKSE